MQVVVTGASTDLGQELLRAIVERGALRRSDGSAAPVRRLLAVDRVQSVAMYVHDQIEYVRGDYEQPRFLARMMGAARDCVFHLSALGAGAGIDGGAEGIDLALLRSVDTTRALLDACRFQMHPPRLVFAGMSGLRSKANAVPESTDAICVDICESLLVECARRGIVDLRSVRLPGAGATTLDLAQSAAALLEAHDRPATVPAVQIIEGDAGGN